MNILNIGIESAKHDTQELFEAGQAERSRLLTQVRDLQLATRLLVQAEARRLALRSPDDARISRLMTTERTLRDRAAVLGSELEVAAIRVPPVSKTDTLVHGRITDDAQRAPGRLTAMLVRADGSALEGVKPVEVDDAGYYAFVIDPATAASLGGQDRLSVTLQRGDKHVAPTAASNFTLKAGTVAVKDVALGDAELRRLSLRGDVGATAGVKVGATVPQTKATKTRKGS